MPYDLSGQARQDILGIWGYIAEDNEAAADRFVELLVQRFQFLAKMPFAGRIRDDLRSGYRSIAFRRYVIFYRVIGSAVQVSRVVHGSRDLIALLGESE